MNSSDRNMEERPEDEEQQNSEEGSEESEESEALENIDKPFEIRPWVTPTVEETSKEIEAPNFVNSRPVIRTQFLKKRKDFGMPPKMNDKEATDFPEIRQQSDKDPTFFSQVKIKVLEIGLQAANQTVEAATQVHYARPINKAVDVNPQKLVVPGEVDESSLVNFLSTAYPLMEEALQANETIDIFRNEFDIIPEEEIVTEGGTETTNDIKEIKSFTGLMCNDKKITCIQFAPSTADPIYKYIVAESFVENWSFDKRLDETLKSNESFILVLDFEELHMVQPMFKLVSPVEILSFDFHPTNPNKIVGGGINGQVFSWDLKGALRVQSTKDKKKKKEKREEQEIPRILPEMISAPQEPNAIPQASSELVKKNVNSHKGPAMCVRWLPKNIRYDTKNIYNLLPNNQEVSQFLSISTDCQVLFWETKYPPEKDPRVYPEAYPWRATFAIQLFRPGGGGTLGGVNLIFHKEQKTSTFYGTSDEGELFAVDWTTKPTDENPRADMITGIWSTERAFRGCVGLDRSHFDDIVLTLYDFYFAIWKAEIEVPIFTSMVIQGAHITCGAFSPFRPGVVIIGRSDGYLDVWDFIDQSHKYIIHQSVASLGLSSLRFHETLPNILGVGDMNGNLHILELPKSLCKKIGTEETTVGDFWKREVERVKYVDRRWNVRADVLKKVKAEEEKKEAAESMSKKDTKKDESELSDDEKEEQDYQKFVQEYIEEAIEGKAPKPVDPKAAAAKGPGQK